MIAMQVMYTLHWLFNFELFSRKNNGVIVHIQVYHVRFYIKTFCDYSLFPYFWYTLFTFVKFTQLFSRWYNSDFLPKSSCSKFTDTNPECYLYTNMKRCKTFRIKDVFWNFHVPCFFMMVFKILKDFEGE